MGTFESCFCFVDIPVFVRFVVSDDGCQRWVVLQYYIQPRTECHVVTGWAHLPNGFMYEGGMQLFNKSLLHYAATKECLNLVSQLDWVNLFSGR